MTWACFGRFTFIRHIWMHFPRRLDITVLCKPSLGKTQRSSFSPETFVWSGEVSSRHPSVHCVWDCSMKSGSLWGVDSPYKIKEKARKVGKEGSKGKVGDSWIPSTLNAPTERQQLHFLNSKRETQCQWNRQRKAAAYEKVSTITVHWCSVSQRTSAFVISDS